MADKDEYDGKPNKVSSTFHATRNKLHDKWRLWQPWKDSSPLAMYQAADEARSKAQRLQGRILASKAVTQEHRDELIAKMTHIRSDLVQSFMPPGPTKQQLDEVKDLKDQIASLDRAKTQATALQSQNDELKQQMNEMRQAGLETAFWTKEHHKILVEVRELQKEAGIVSDVTLDRKGYEALYEQHIESEQLLTRLRVIDSKRKTAEYLCGQSLKQGKCKTLEELRKKAGAKFAEMTTKNTESVAAHSEATMIKEYDERIKTVEHELEKLSLSSTQSTHASVETAKDTLRDREAALVQARIDACKSEQESKMYQAAIETTKSDIGKEQKEAKSLNGKLDKLKEQLETDHDQLTVVRMGNELLCAEVDAWTGGLRIVGELYESIAERLDDPVAVKDLKKQYISGLKGFFEGETKDMERQAENEAYQTAHASIQQRDCASPVSDDAVDAARTRMTQSVVKSVQNEVNGVKLKTINQRTSEIHCDEVNDLTAALKEAKAAQREKVEKAANNEALNDQNAAAVDAVRAKTEQIRIDGVKDFATDLKRVRDARDEKIGTAANNDALNAQNAATVDAVRAKTEQIRIDGVKDFTNELKIARDARGEKVRTAANNDALNAQNAATVDAVRAKTEQIRIDAVKDFTNELKIVREARDTKIRTAADNDALNVQNTATVSATRTAAAQISLDEVKDFTNDLKLARDDRDEKLRVAAGNQASNERNTAFVKAINAETEQTRVDAVNDCASQLNAARESQQQVLRKAAEVEAQNTRNTETVIAIKAETNKVKVDEVTDFTTQLSEALAEQQTTLDLSAAARTKNTRNESEMKAIAAETASIAVDEVKDLSAEFKEALDAQQTTLNLSAAARANNTRNESEVKAMAAETASIAVDKVKDLTPQIKDALTSQQSRLDESVRAIASNIRNESEVKAILAETESIAVDKVRDLTPQIKDARTKLQESVDAQVEESRNEMELQAIEASTSDILVDSVKDCKLQVDDAKSKQRERAAQAANNDASNLVSQCQIDAIMQATNTIELVELKNLDLKEEIETKKMESRARDSARNTATNLAKQSKIAAITAQAKSMVDNADQVKDFTREMTEANDKQWQAASSVADKESVKCMKELKIQAITTQAQETENESATLQRELDDPEAKINKDLEGAENRLEERCRQHAQCKTVVAKQGHRKHFLLEEIKAEDEKIAALQKQHKEDDNTELRQQYRAKRYKSGELQGKQICEEATLAAMKAMSGELDAEIDQYKEQSPARASSISVFVDGVKRRLGCLSSAMSKGAAWEHAEHMKVVYRDQSTATVLLLTEAIDQLGRHTASLNPQPGDFTGIQSTLDNVARVITELIENAPAGSRDSLTAAMLPGQTALEATKQASKDGADYSHRVEQGVKAMYGTFQGIMMWMQPEPPAIEVLQAMLQVGQIDVPEAPHPSLCVVQDAHLSWEMSIVGSDAVAPAGRFQPHPVSIWVRLQDNTIELRSLLAAIEMMRDAQTAGHTLSPTDVRIIMDCVSRAIDKCKAVQRQGQSPYLNLLGFVVPIRLLELLARTPGSLTIAFARQKLDALAKLVTSTLAQEVLNVLEHAIFPTHGGQPSKLLTSNQGTVREVEGCFLFAVGKRGERVLVIAAEEEVEKLNIVGINYVKVMGERRPARVLPLLQKVKV